MNFKHFLSEFNLLIKNILLMYNNFFSLTDKYRYTNSQVREINAILALEYNSINGKTSEIYINLYYNKPLHKQDHNSRYSLYLSQIHIKDMNGLRYVRIMHHLFIYYY